MPRLMNDRDPASPREAKFAWGEATPSTLAVLRESVLQIQHCSAICIVNGERNVVRRAFREQLDPARVALGDAEHFLPNHCTVDCCLLTQLYCTVMRLGFLRATQNCQSRDGLPSGMSWKPVTTAKPRSSALDRFVTGLRRRAHRCNWRQLTEALHASIREVDRPNVRCVQVLTGLCPNALLRLRGETGRCTICRSSKEMDDSVIGRS